MTKEELLFELSEKINQNEITREEVLQILNPYIGQPIPVKHNKSNITRMLYVLGAAIVIIGILIFVGQIWEDIGSIGRIIVTLVLGLVFAVTGSMLLKDRPQENIGSVFHFIGGALIPTGALVTLAEFSSGAPTVAPIAMTFALLTIFYAVLATTHKKAVLTFFTITNATTCIYLSTQTMLNAAYSSDWKIFVYLTMVIGISYLLLSHSFKNTWNNSLVGLLHFFGILYLLGAAFSQVFDSGGWQLLYFLLLFAGFYLSVILQSKAILIVSTLFLIAHVTFITGEYFANSMGWPISLVLLGFFFIALGYGSITINKKYINNPKSNI